MEAQQAPVRRSFQPSGERLGEAAEQGGHCKMSSLPSSTSQEQWGPESILTLLSPDLLGSPAQLFLCYVHLINLMS